MPAASVDRKTLAELAAAGVVPDRAAALKHAHRAAAYDKWFRAKVQESLDDPRANIPHDEVSARWSKKRAQFARKAAGTQGARD